MGRAGDRGLHFLLGHVDVELETELQRDDRAAVRTRRGHLVQARELAELPLERGCHGRGHHFGARAWIKRFYLNGRIIDLRQGGNRQLAVRDEAHQQNTHHQKRRGDWPQNERPGWTPSGFPRDSPSSPPSLPPPPPPPLRPPSPPAQP